jgi:hypothetical protein
MYTRTASEATEITKGIATIGGLLLHAHKPTWIKNYKACNYTNSDVESEGEEKL